MSLWTPDGERPVRRQPAEPAADAGQPGAPSQEELLEIIAAANGISLDQLPSDKRHEIETQIASLSAEERATIAAEMAQMGEVLRVRGELAEIPAPVHLGRFLESFLDLASSYLESDPPKFTDAATIIGAVDAVLATVGDQLGEQQAAAEQFSAQLKQAFVALKQQHDDGVAVVADEGSPGVDG